MRPQNQVENQLQDAVAVETAVRRTPLRVDIPVEAGQHRTPIATPLQTPRVSPRRMTVDNPQVIEAREMARGAQLVNEIQQGIQRIGLTEIPNPNAQNPNVARPVAGQTTAQPVARQNIAVQPVAAPVVGQPAQMNNRVATVNPAQPVSEATWEARFKALQEQYDSQQTLLNTTQTERTELELQNTQLRTSISRIELERDNARTSNLQLKRENDALKKQLAIYQAPKPKPFKAEVFAMRSGWSRA